MELYSYSPVAIAILLSIGFALFFSALGVFVGPKRTSAVKNATFECGSEPIGSPRGRYSVKFYQVAILFLVFDIEAAFMYPWAVRYRELSMMNGNIVIFGFVEMFLFVTILGVALAYVWRKKAIGWE